jgi:hypothetical protein
MTERVSLIADSLAGGPLHYTNEGGGFRYEPREFTVAVDLATLERLHGPSDRRRLTAPAGWIVTPTAGDQAGAAGRRWRVEPIGAPAACLLNLHLIVARPGGGETEFVHPVPVEIVGRTQFDPARHALPLANAAAEWGEVAPDRAVFDRTYRRGALAGAFFRGLYSEVVYLTADAARRPGGLCTGIARSTLELSLRRPAAGLTDEPIESRRRAALLWHGRQLADRALLASALAWLTRGSRDAYLTFRRQVLTAGETRLAFDVNVPRPWRRDLLTAFVGSGHTVVPYALRQRSDAEAEVWVYDPNYPRPEQTADSVIRFDLERDSYRYRHYDGARPGAPSKVLAVHQDRYRAADTAYLSGLLNLLLYPRSWWPARRPTAAGALLALLLGLLLAGRGAGG